MALILGWMLVVNQTPTPTENSTVILALCCGNDIVLGMWFAEIKGLLNVPSPQHEMTGAPLYLYYQSCQAEKSPCTSVVLW